MRAAYIEQTGPPEAIQVGDLPRPEPGPGQVLVRVRATALNPIDLYIRSGMVAMPMSFPHVIGADFAGTVEALGPGATRFQVGDRVWGSNQGMLGRQGADGRVRRRSTRPSPTRPRRTSPTPRPPARPWSGSRRTSACSGKAQLQAGETVYVPGGSGGVGSMVVQMAKAAGARVATSAGSPEKVELCKALGADLALNYKTDDIPARLREFAPEGIDVWYETTATPTSRSTSPCSASGAG